MNEAMKRRLFQAACEQSEWWMDAAAAATINLVLESAAFDRALALIWNSYVVNDDRTRRMFGRPPASRDDLSGRMFFRRSWMHNCHAARKRFLAEKATATRGVSDDA